MRLLRVPVLAAGLVLLAIMGSPIRRSAQGLELGPFRILPSLEFAIEYDDNILLTQTDELDDFIFHIIPGIRSSCRPGNTPSVSATRLTSCATRKTPTWTPSTTRRSPTRASISISAWGSGSPTGSSSPMISRASRCRSSRSGWSGGRTRSTSARTTPCASAYTLDVNYRWFMVDYKDDPDVEQFDRDDHTIAGTFFYRVLPKTSILGEVDYNIVRYDMPAVAADPRLRRLALSRGREGRHDRQDVGPPQDRLGMAGLRERFREDWDGFIAEGNVIWKYREPSEVRLFGGRANVESLFEGPNYYVSSYGGAEVRHFLSER